MEVGVWQGHSHDNHTYFFIGMHMLNACPREVTRTLLSTLYGTRRSFKGFSLPSFCC